MSGGRDREEQLDSDLREIEIRFEDDDVAEGDSEPLLDPGLVLGYSPAQQVRSHSKLINDAGHTSPHTTLCPVE
jgi:hypothetical protein